MKLLSQIPSSYAILHGGVACGLTLPYVSFSGQLGIFCFSDCFSNVFMYFSKKYFDRKVPSFLSGTFSDWSKFYISIVSLI